MNFISGGPSTPAFFCISCVAGDVKNAKKASLDGAVPITIALFGGIIISLPIVLYQLWRFIAPAFENKYTLTVFYAILFSLIFFIIGITLSKSSRVLTFLSKSPSSPAASAGL